MARVSTTAGRPRPVLEAANRQIWWTIGGALLPGAILLATVLASGRPITSTDLGAALLAILTPLAAAEVVRRRTVNQAEDDTTPVASPRDQWGRVLTTRDRDLLQQALEQLAVDRGYLPPDAASTTDSAPAAPGAVAADPEPVPTTGTSRYPTYEAARPATTADAESWAPRGARIYDAAAERGQDAAVVQGRAMADRRDRVTADARSRHAARGPASTARR